MTTITKIGNIISIRVLRVDEQSTTFELMVTDTSHNVVVIPISGDCDLGMLEQAVFEIKLQRAKDRGLLL